MTKKFADAMNKGIEAAQRAAEARAEIKDVLAQLRDELMAATDNKISVRVVTAHRRVGPLKILEPFLNSLNSQKYTAIAIVREDVEGFTPREIAEWTQPASGYPCRIVAGMLDNQCGDREALEAELESLLSTVKAGEAFLEARGFVPAKVAAVPDSSADIDASNSPTP